MIVVSMQWDQDESYSDYLCKRVGNKRWVMENFETGTYEFSKTNIIMFKNGEDALIFVLKSGYEIIANKPS